MQLRAYNVLLRMRVQYVQQSNCGCIRVWAMYVLWYGRGSAIVCTYTVQRALQLTFDLCVHNALLLASMMLRVSVNDFGVCIVHIEKYITQHGDSPSWGFPVCVMGIPNYVMGIPNYVMGRPSGCLLAGSVCKHARWLSRTEQVSRYFYSALRSCLHDLTVQYSPFSLFVHTYSTVTSGCACVAVCWRKTLSTTRGRQKHGPSLAGQCQFCHQVLNLWSLHNHEQFCHQRTSTTPAQRVSVNDFGIVEFALYTLKVHYTAWGFPDA